eukprot:2363585-Pyramimonas_sp.AAC.1
MLPEVHIGLRRDGPPGSELLAGDLVTEEDDTGGDVGLRFGGPGLTRRGHHDASSRFKHPTKTGTSDSRARSSKSVGKPEFWRTR